MEGVGAFKEMGACRRPTLCTVEISGDLLIFRAKAYAYFERLSEE